MPVITCGRRNVLVYRPLKIERMWSQLNVDQHHINVKTLPNFDHLVNQRQFPYKDTKSE